MMTVNTTTGAQRPHASDSAGSIPAPIAWWRKEDWLAVWLGSVILFIIGLGLAPATPALKWRDLSSASAILSPAVTGPWLLVGVAVWGLSAAGVALNGGNLARYLLGFPFVFILAWLSQLLAGHATAGAWGIEYVIFALSLGLLVGHLTGAREWLREAARTEFFIKTGLVVMGATILFEEVLQAGVLGLLQAIAVVSVVWYVAFWLARHFRLDDELGVMLSSAVSICGVSAAIAACGAIQGDRRKLSYVTSVVLIVAMPMIVLQPWLVRLAGIPDVVAGAWLGGTLDTTGSVVAAGALISEAAMKVGTIVKLSQNVLIGVAAFLLSIWWTLRESAEPRSRPSVAVIWDRFPKFVLGFAAASLVFSFLLAPELIASTKGAIATARTTWFALAFVSIGIEANLTQLVRLDGARPLACFLCAQAFNVLWTLVLAWLIFGGVLLPAPAI